jgi:hypothetical protein
MEDSDYYSEDSDEKELKIPDDMEFDIPVETIEEFIRIFLNNIFHVEETRDKILMVWGKHPTKDGVIPSMQNLISMLAFNKMDFNITPSYIEFFRDCVTLRIQRNNLGEDTLRQIEFFTHKNIWQHFFNAKTQTNFSGFSSFYRFKHNNILEKHFPRIYLINIIIFKTLMVGISVDQEKYYIDCIQILLASIQNILFGSSSNTAKNNQGNNIPKPPSKIEIHLLDILAILRSDTLYHKLRQIHYNRVSPQFNYDTSKFTLPSIDESIQTIFTKK